MSPQFRVDVDPKEVDPQGDYGTPTAGLWFMSAMVNFFYLMLFGYDDPSAQSVAFPLLFAFVVVGSLVVLKRVKRVRRMIKVILLLNIVTSGLLLLFFVLDILTR